MLLEVYDAVETKLIADVPEIKILDWFNDQYEGTIHDAPAVLVEFPVPLKFVTHRDKYQSADLIVRIHAASKVVSDQAKKIAHASLEAHEALALSVFNSLQGLGAKYGDGNQLIGSLKRIDLTHHQYIKGWLMTTQDFECKIYQNVILDTGQVTEIEITGTPKYKFD